MTKSMFDLYGFKITHYPLLQPLPTIYSTNTMYRLWLELICILFGMIHFFKKCIKVAKSND